MKIRARYLLVLASVLLLSYLIAQLDFAKAGAALSKADYFLLLSAFAVTLLAMGARTYRWKFLLDERRKLGFWQVFAVQCAGIAASNFSPGKALEAVKVIPLKKNGFSYDFGLLTVFWERAFDVLLIISFAFLAFPFLNETIKLAILALFALLIAVMLLMLRHFHKVLRVLSRISFLSILKKVEAHNFRKTTLLAVFFSSIVIWLLDFTSIYLAFSSIGVNFDFLHLASTFSASVLIGLLSFLPGGIGSTEGAWALLLGTEASIVLTAVFLARLTTFWFSSILGFALLPLVKKS
ncbi:flippase-like domain-containing protein [Candidatus Micrarchaeota archaeon]|nr:flippase-like domain-containing protein [Candidatus Micrarchaeota archaeon]